MTRNHWMGRRNLYLVGDAPSGWEITNHTYGPQRKHPTYEGALNAGEFKIATIFDWGGDFIVLQSTKQKLAVQGIADGTVVWWKEDAEAGHADHKWKVTEAGNYRLILDTNTYDKSGMVGRVVKVDFGISCVSIAFCQCWCSGYKYTRKT